MMWWPAGGMTGWGWVAMTISIVLFWAVLLLGAVALYRAVSRPTGEGRVESPRPTAEQLLAERYARGEIDEDEFQRRRATLTGFGHIAPTP